MEIRWFFPGSIPSEVADGFDTSLGKAVRQTPRVDHYLYPIDTDTLGIKRREGKLELKRRLSQQGVIHFRQGVAGRMETWCKWGFELAGLDPDFHNPNLANAAWLEVHKERLLRNYTITESGEVVMVDPETRLDRGCHLELSHIRAAQQQWWSLGLEAFGPSASLASTLLAAAKNIFSTEQKMMLKAENSYGYPHWFHRLPLDMDPCPGR